MDTYGLLFRITFSDKEPEISYIGFNLTGEECAQLEEHRTNKYANRSNVLNLEFKREKMDETIARMEANDMGWIIKRNVNNLFSMQGFMVNSVLALREVTEHVAAFGQYTMFVEKSGQEDGLHGELSKIKDTIAENLEVLSASVKYLEEINNSRAADRLPN